MNLVRPAGVIVLPYFLRLQLLQLLLIDNLLQELLQHQRKVRHQEVAGADRVFVVVVQEEVMLLKVSPVVVAAAHLVAYQAALVEAGLLCEEEALLLDLNWTHCSIFGYLDWLAYSDKGAKFRIEVHQVNLFVFEGKSGLASRHRDVRNRDVIVDAPTDLEDILGSEVDNMDSLGWALDV